MRAVLIDPRKRAFTELRLESDDYREIRAALQCRSFTIGAYLSGSPSTGYEVVYVSDDCLEDADDPKFWFQIDADRDPPTSHPIAGWGLVVGADQDGEDADARISVAELASRVTFTRRKFRGFKTSEIPGGLAVTVNAPIVDGE